MRKKSSSKWDNECEGDFDEVRKILVSLSVMGKPDEEHDLQL